MFKKLIKVLIPLLLCTPIINMSITQANDDSNRFPILVDTIKDKRAKLTARYEPNNQTYCSAIIISPTLALTAKHCHLNKSSKEYSGTIYPGQSGMSTPYGHMNITNYIPNDANDIAILKGNEIDQSNDYKHYMKDAHIDLTPFSKEQIKSLKGKEVYTYGYPYNQGGLKQYKSTGIITNYNPVTDELETTLPAVEGQSGSGVFLKDNNQFIGILYGSYNTNQGLSGKVMTINERLYNWINTYKN
ncbi:serine protease [Staphylococcus hyicus]|uniref:Trypsin-like serine peptidase n=1 Tax=Staphylococcus hyicus TaxID=1284 RepID=A0ACD5FNN0_STAHY|nr:trypsin-like serine protease [Staphylococcus hyicus]MDP4462594.1 trypsin-like serine protease [Staphylococcus hyicus]